MLEPLLVSEHPTLISDGAGLAFPVAALASSPGSLDPEDPAVRVLIAQIKGEAAVKLSAPWKRDAAPTAPPPSLEAWRVLARSADQVLFGRGRPPQLLTVAVRQEGRRRRWTCDGVSKARPLRAARDGIRASSWRLDPGQELLPTTTALRILVTEQTYSGAQRAHGRVLAPDLYADAEELVLTMFVTPKPGFQVRAPNPETPVRVTLPDPIGVRELVDGALYDADQ